MGCCRKGNSNFNVISSIKEDNVFDKDRIIDKIACHDRIRDASKYNRPIHIIIPYYNI